MAVHHEQGHRTIQGMTVYELTLTNPDNTTGFAVMADPEVIDEVIAYVPVGSLVDTLYNKGMASYFRELASLADAVSQQMALADTVSRQPLTRNYGPAGPWDDTYRQPGYLDIFNIGIGYDEFVRFLTREESAQKNQYFSLYYCDPPHHEEITGTYVPTKWGQGNPYNNRVRYKVNGTNRNVVVGCLAIAIGQVMAFHRYPASYNWNSIMSNGTTVPATPVYGDGSIITSLETAAQREVSRLLYDVAIAGPTLFDPVHDTGAASEYMIVPVLNAMGYSATMTFMDNYHQSSTQTIKDEISAYRRPVIYYALSDTHRGHFWVVDAILTQERWEYKSVWCYGGAHGASYDGQEAILRWRTQGNLLHCNWGWYGYGNGWFFNFTAPHYKHGPVYFYRDKYLYTGIEPR